MVWKHPPLTKIYEALGAVADGRVKIEGCQATCYSSSGNKFYTITYDVADKAIMCNDNASYYHGYLGYPAIAYLITVGLLPYEAGIANLLKGVAWKDLNQEYNNDFERTLESILVKLDPVDRSNLDSFVSKIDAKISSLAFKQLGEKTKPPVGY